MSRQQNVAERLAALREVLRRERLGAFIFPTSDPHQSEYTADHWKSREWISGFDGSAGTAVVTMTSAALWTDSRYFLAAEEQLAGTGYQLMRLKVDGTPTIAEWLSGELLGRGGSQRTSGSTEVAVDGTVCSHSMVQELTADLRRHGGITLRTNLDPLRSIWTDRPPLPKTPIVVHPLELSGEDTPDKLARIRRALRQHHADGMLMAALDDIAWTLNLRGSDVHCCPVFVAYLLISTTGATLFVDRDKLTPEVASHLRRCGVGVDDYANVRKGLKDYFEQTILMDPDEVNHTLFASSVRDVVSLPSPVPLMKAVKTPQEQEGFRRAMTRDGVALVRFLMWLEGECSKGLQGVSEFTVDEVLTRLRSQQEGFRGLSFDTIAGYAAHGAIVHYEATPQTASTLRPEGLLLLDSGAHYDCGTTDVTRTIALGPLTPEQRRVYTLVLKGHLRLQNLVFPDGASGTQLDAIARSPLWAEGLNYLHGTGHGVGSCLNVHEGPHQIRMEWRPSPLRAGMTVTDEPGIYLAGRFGVRIENTLLVVPHAETEHGRFLRFEPLTLCPIDLRPVEPELLSSEEKAWLGQYHRLVVERLSPHLEPHEQQWLRRVTQLA